MTDTSESWREQGENMGLNEETARIELYCNHRDKEDWKQEAEEQRYTSLSKYLRDMIDLGRAYRNEGLRGQANTDDRIRELEATIEALEQQLAEQESQSVDPDLVDTDLVESLLTEQYQSIEEILDQVTEYEALQDTLKKPVKEALVALAKADRAEYQRGHGWRLGGDS
jgi:hypothetical protein